MNTTVNAEQAWQDLQRIRVPQERVYDEVEKCAAGDPRATYATAGIMWLFLAGMGLDLPKWGVWLMLAAYVGVLSSLAVCIRDRAGGAAVSGGTILLSGRLVESLALPFGSLITATVSVLAFLLFVGPANRWAVAPLRDRSTRAPSERAIR